MGKYDFIKQDNLLYWNDPDNGFSNGVYKVISVPEKVYSDSIILITNDFSEAEVFASELSPIHSGRSHKEEFSRWKAEREVEGMKFYNRLSEVIETDCDLAVGDTVVFINDFGVIFGLHEVLAFREPWNGSRCVYIDSDAYWFPKHPDQLALVSERSTE